MLSSTLTGLAIVGIQNLALGDTATLAGGATGGLITTEVYGGDFNKNFVNGFVHGYTDMYFNDMGVKEQRHH